MQFAGQMVVNMVDPELDALKREFLTEAEEKVREIETVLNGGNELERIAYIAHQLKGSGGSYGYARISAVAAEIERAVEEDDGHASDRIRVQVSTLFEEIARRSRELSA